tara:strand:- start:102 stop:245 length:144 start_codon:yes stop_codon:yes gene_type:complete
LNNSFLFLVKIIDKIVEASPEKNVRPQFLALRRAGVLAHPSLSERSK